MIPLQKPLLPPAEAVMKYLKMIDETRWYANSGPLLHLYEQKLSEIFKCHVVATSSGTSGLIAALMALGILGRKLVLPSWTFVATANAVKVAGAEISFFDVEEDTWQSLTDIGTTPFGQPLILGSKNCYLAIDAAAAFDAYATGECEVGRTPVVISTHATKTFSTGEGGLVLTTDVKLAQRVREIINHGMTQEREVPTAGINGKMSEYHAAVGLASLDYWPLRRSQWWNTKRMYNDIFGLLAQTTPLASLDWVSSTFAIRLEHRNLDSVMDGLKAKGIMSRRVWGRGVHRYEAYKNCPRDDLSVTEKLADSVLFLPFQVDMPEHEVHRIKSAVMSVLNDEEHEPNMWNV